MGFSVSAASLILVVGIFAYASVLAQSYFGSQQEVLESMRHAEARLESDRQGALAVDDVAHNATQLVAYINATNSGSITYNLQRLDVLIDGQVVTANVTVQLVQGTATDVWPPLARLELHISNVDLAPQNVIVVAPTGAKGYWRA